jgi:hypothetical protein
MPDVVQRETIMPLRRLKTERPLTATERSRRHRLSRRGIEPPPAPGRERLTPGIGLDADELGLISLEELLEKLTDPVPTVEDAA